MPTKPEAAAGPGNDAGVVPEEVELSGKLVRLFDRLDSRDKIFLFAARRASSLLNSLPSLSTRSDSAVVFKLSAFFSLISVSSRNFRSLSTCLKALSSSTRKTSNSAAFAFSAFACSCCSSSSCIRRLSASALALRASISALSASLLCFRRPKSLAAMRRVRNSILARALRSRFCNVMRARRKHFHFFFTIKPRIMRCKVTTFRVRATSRIVRRDRRPRYRLCSK
mmetsp:Transcript_34142/g.46892  ORF Transcript_34142/g.46892 Transcript_34142/m.46892 type:complete len:225 (+) Transcript_34142:1735-2409(+)